MFTKCRKATKAEKPVLALLVLCGSLGEERHSCRGACEICVQKVDAFAQKREREHGERVAESTHSPLWSSSSFSFFLPLSLSLARSLPSSLCARKAVVPYINHGHFTYESCYSRFLRGSGKHWHKKIRAWGGCCRAHKHPEKIFGQSKGKISASFFPLSPPFQDLVG